jgi:hypothetical protein
VRVGVVVSKSGKLREGGFIEMPEYIAYIPSGFVTVTTQNLELPIVLAGTVIEMSVGVTLKKCQCEQV